MGRRCTSRRKLLAKKGKRLYACLVDKLDNIKRGIGPKIPEEHHCVEGVDDDEASPIEMYWRLPYYKHKLNQIHFFVGRVHMVQVIEGCTEVQQKEKSRVLDINSTEEVIKNSRQSCLMSHTTCGLKLQ